MATDPTPAPRTCTVCGSDDTNSLLKPGFVLDPTVRYCNACWSIYTARPTGEPTP